MIKKIYKNFIVIGLASGIIAGIFFICSLQTQLVKKDAQREAIMQSQDFGVLLFSGKPGEDEALRYSSISQNIFFELEKEVLNEYNYIPLTNESSNELLVSDGSSVTGVQLLYTTPEIMQVLKTNMISGSFQNNKSDCAVNANLLDNLGFSYEVPRKISIGETRFSVSAVINDPQHSAANRLLGFDNMSIVVLPFNEYIKQDNSFVSMIFLKPSDGAEYSGFEKELEQVSLKSNELLKRHSAQETDFQFVSYTGEQIYTIMNSSDGESAVYVLMFFLTFLAEFLACVNIMSIASAALRRNKKEIGIKLALGASYGAVYKEYFADMILLLSKGLLIGLCVSSAAVYFMNEFSGQFLFNFDLNTILLSVIVSFAAVLMSSLVPFRFIFKRTPAALLKEVR